ncbi:hypothetical protein RDI58_003857 [Solanum bulbocastanum]|uniref:Uncharacterized protein n=1 Tax=Solanum bulbocastanum TaxID=147425 RepID=A0AAN8U2X8_SOLBU
MASDAPSVPGVQVKTNIEPHSPHALDLRRQGQVIITPFPGLMIILRCLIMTH